ncbi:Fatty-acid amide hydrolase 2 [Eumeta japonica]|uniref:Fatty-acid amide hydrolase 2 n=1 Tax=Eumeta variegata TaxID=151549 RepID=A0A4C1YKK2_EUMVA|nr:Fatty-acid amide hydrolase 2 [Eumeta japonica]
MARHAEDLLPLFKIMAGQNASILRLDEAVDVAKVKVYYMTESTISSALLPVDKDIKAMLQRAVEYLTEASGAQLRYCSGGARPNAHVYDIGFTFIPSEKENLKLNELNFNMSNFVARSPQRREAVSVLCAAATFSGVTAVLADLGKKDKSLFIEFIKYVFGGASHSLQGLGFALIDRTKLFMRSSRRAHYAAKANKLREKLQTTLGDNGVFLYPAFNELAHYHNQVFVKASGVMYTMMFNILGMPSTCVPLGLCRGLPVGIQRPRTEPKVAERDGHQDRGAYGLMDVVDHRRLRVTRDRTSWKPEMEACVHHRRPVAETFKCKFRSYSFNTIHQNGGFCFFIDSYSGCLLVAMN